VRENYYSYCLRLLLLLLLFSQCVLMCGSFEGSEARAMYLLSCINQQVACISRNTHG